MLKYFFLLISILYVGIASDSLACTRILSSDNGQAVIVGRTMDWQDHSMPVKLVVYPRNIKRDGMAANPLQWTSLKWTSKYASVTATVFDAMTLDGMNEKGLGAHLLWMDSTHYCKSSTEIPLLSLLLWAQYYLDNFANVKDAVEFTQGNHFQIETFYYPGAENDPEGEIKLHLVLEDASGDSAVIEYIKGIVNIHHNASYKVVTNEPKFDEQLKNILKYEGFSGSDLLPGSANSMDRFVKASYHVTHLPQKANDSQEAFTHLLSALNAVSVPYTSNSETDVTIWRIVADLTNKIYYFNLSNSLHFIWIDFAKLDVSKGAPIRELDVSNIDSLCGEVSQAFKIKAK